MAASKREQDAMKDGAAAYNAGRSRKAPDMVPWPGYGEWWLKGYDDEARYASLAEDDDEIRDREWGG